MKRLILLFSALSLALAPACDDNNGSSSESNGSGSGSGSDGPVVSTGLDGDLALSEITDEQQISA